MVMMLQWASVLSSNAVKLNSIETEYVYESTPHQQDQVSATLSAMSTALDPFMFANKLVNNVAASNFKISVGATSAIPPDEIDDLWIDDEPISLMIDLDNIEDSIASLEVKIGAVEKRPRGVSTDYLSKIYISEI